MVICFDFQKYRYSRFYRKITIFAVGGRTVEPFFFNKQTNVIGKAKS